MPMIDCPNPRCQSGYVPPPFQFWYGKWRCVICGGTGRVPDDFFPEDSEELSDPDEEPEPMNREPKERADADS